MKQSIQLSLLVCLLSVSVFADVPNYSGTWILDESKIENNGQKHGAVPSKITIIHEGTQFKTERLLSSPMQGDVTVKEDLTLDGKPCPSDTEVGPRVSTAVWSEEQKAVLIESEMKLNFGGGDYQIQFHETWSIQPDGSLKIHSKRNSPRGERESIYYYKRNK